MFKVINQSGHTAYGLKEFICDTEADISNLSLDETPGSTAFVIASKKTYMMNNQHKWVDITVNFSSNSSGSSSTEFIDYTENFEELKAQTQTLITDNAVLKTQINDLTAHNQTLSDNIDSLISKNESLENNINSLKKSNNSLISKNESLENNINSLKESNNNLIEENKILTEKINFLVDNNISLIDTVSILVEKIDLLQLEIEALKESHEEDKDGGEIYIEGTMNMDDIPVEINEDTNTLIIDASNTEIQGNTLIIK